MKGGFSYDALFANLVNGLLPSFVEEEADSADTDTLSSSKSAKGLSSPLFPEVDTLLLIFKDSCTQLVDLRKQVDINFVFFLPFSSLSMNILLRFYAPNTCLALMFVQD